MMFRQIRKRLTIFNSLLMACVMIILIAITYISLALAIYTEVKQEVYMNTEEEARECVILLRQKENQPNIPVVNEEEDDTDSFFYAFDTKGNLLDKHEPDIWLRQPILENIRNWRAEQGKVELFKIKQSNTKEKRYIMMCSLLLKDGDKIWGTIYVGRDISGYFRILETFLIILLLVSLGALGIISIAGYLIAGRAMVPIRNSFDRQREFVADASHELRTPLSVLMASVDVIQNDDNNRMSPFSEQVLSDMKDEIKKMSKIVGDLLTLARADAAVLKIFKEKFDIRPIAEQVMRSLQPLASKKNIRLQLICPDKCEIFADKERIRQLLLILLDNAIKYNVDGGQVEVSLSKQLVHRQEMKICVSDTGFGIDEKDKQQIFERFYRVDKVRSREMGGTGLGLAIAKWIVEAHNGTISVKSEINSGSVFTVIMPL